MAQHTAQHLLRDQQRKQQQQQRRRGGRAGAGTAAAPAILPPPDDATTPPATINPNNTPWRYDWLRTARLCAYSALLGTPIAHWWFAALDSGALLPAAARASAAATVVAKTLLDQVVMAPIGLSLFFTSVAAMEGKSPGEAVESARARIRPALAANFLLWPAAQAVNFALVPPRQRILYVNVIAVFWCAVLSHLASAPTAGDGEGAGGGKRGKGGGTTASPLPPLSGTTPPDTFVPVVP